MGRAPCCDKAKVKRGPWSPEEDTVLKSYVERYGTGGNWIALPHKAGLKRCGKSCRLRWLNYLRPDIRHGDFTEEEDNIICGLYRNIGSRWSVIASHLQGRTDNDVKNYWNTKLKRKVLLSNGQSNLTSITTPSPVEVESFGQDRVSAFVNQPTSTNFAGNSIGYVVSPSAQDISAASSSLTMENSHNYMSWPESTGTSGWAGVAGDNGSTINTSFDINPPLPLPPPPPDFFNWFNVQDGFFGEEDKTTYNDPSLSNLSNLWASIESNYQMDCTNFSNTHT